MEMKEPKRTVRQSEEVLDREHRFGKQESRPSPDSSHAWDLDSLIDMPFWPRAGSHSALLAKAQSDDQRANLIARLQQTYGNCYVQRLLSAMAIQAKMSVNAPNDIYEQGADRVVEQVVRKVNSQAQRQEDEELETKPDSDIWRQPEEEEEKLQAKPASDIRRQEEAGLKAKPVSEDLEARIKSACGNGQPLSADVREPMERARRQVEWGSKAGPSDTASIESQWSAAASQSGVGVPWAASETAQTIAEPQQISWGATKELADAGAIPCVINASAPTGLGGIQAAWGNHAWAVAPFPTGFKAPDFDFNATEKKDASGESQWVAKPTLTQKAFEGNSQPVHPAVGVYKQPQAEPASKVPVFANISAGMSKLLGAAENEHARDYKYAYLISLERAQYALTRGIIDKSLGPKPTKGEVEQMVLDRLKRYIHANTGNDKTKWADMYKALYLKTLERDNKGWHTLPCGNRREIKDAKGTVTKVMYDVVRGPDTKIGVVPPGRIIKY
jgi:hypothetical protein